MAVFEKLNSQIKKTIFTILLDLIQPNNFMLKQPCFSLAAQTKGTFCGNLACAGFNGKLLAKLPREQKFDY